MHTSSAWTADGKAHACRALTIVINSYIRQVPLLVVNISGNLNSHASNSTGNTLYVTGYHTSPRMLGGQGRERMSF